MSDAVFYFTGTGNSLQIARAIAERLGCRAIDITGLPAGDVDVSGYDRIGFVFPVHYYKAPLAIEDAVSRMHLGRDQSVWAAMDYGTTPGDARARTFRLLESTGAKVLFSIGCQMPENYIMMFKVPPQDECDRLLSAVPSFADRVVSMVSSGSVTEPESSMSGRMISFLGSPFYDLWRNTGKFSVNWRCTSCGLCSEICPSHAIVMTDEGPRWTEAKCYHCAGCINRCPAEAIQYGHRTSSKRRYVNPALRNE